MKQINEKIINEICEMYKTNSIETICKHFKMGDRRVRKILLDNNIPIKNSHEKTVSTDEYIEKNQMRFPEINGKRYVMKSKITGEEFTDYLNTSGVLIRHIKKKLNIEIPSLFKRKKYFHENNKQWHEQWFETVLRDDEKIQTKKCPYCEWETIDIENKSGMFMVHLRNEHGVSIEDYLLQHPEDKEYFSKQNKIQERNERLKDEKNYVICPICGEKYEKITYWHLINRHNMNYNQFIQQYPNTPVISDNMLKQAQSVYPLGNLTVSKNRFVSKYEKEIQAFLTKYGIEFSCNRQILGGNEIDILIPDKKIGIEFDGLKFHTEWFGKKEHQYHLNKTRICNEHGYGLIHIFEDEFVNKKDIVFNKIKHIIGLDTNKRKAYGRKCNIKEIYKNDAEQFLEKYHIQGFSSSSLYLGAFYEETLVGVMTFKNGNLKNNGWELTRFATHSEYNCCGLGGKLFSYFIKNYNPHQVHSFADRRWTIDIKNNLYTKLGFNIDKISNPDYKYYNEKVNRYERVHKMRFNKKTLAKKYGFPLTMTETEMAKALGYDRIWDCGLIKYVWKKIMLN